MRVQIAGESTSFIPPEINCGLVDDYHMLTQEKPNSGYVGL
jgi:hypothetical protein